MQKKLQRPRTREVNKHGGSSFDSFLKEEGILEKLQTVARKRVLGWQVAQKAKKIKVSTV